VEASRSDYSRASRASSRPGGTLVRPRGSGIRGVRRARDAATLRAAAGARVTGRRAYRLRRSLPRSSSAAGSRDSRVREVPVVRKFASRHSLLTTAHIDLRFRRSTRYFNDELDQEFHSGPPRRFALALAVDDTFAGRRDLRDLRGREDQARACFPSASASLSGCSSGAASDDPQDLARRGGWLLQPAIPEVARQAKSRAPRRVVRGREIRHIRVSQTS
jgi:hypothetical protein